MAIESVTFRPANGSANVLACHVHGWIDCIFRLFGCAGLRSRCPATTGSRRLGSCPGYARTVASATASGGMHAHGARHGRFVTCPPAAKARGRAAVVP